eukprot:CAMPEP_0185847730 /NCGR_PEP_ID=MMETSP1354-20130828/2891_1 /TAXON_ID=708628 /ORGANISM="Erythrolobus madagascarensis, Strain CCMP3276" /LENGTH=588 /DNA_ID=CAMNT_0028548059 /DNA_START=197 /DNA_END=1963 /DNA_ORIENTATION=-
MVVLAAAVTSKSGKLLLSRQFVNFSRVRIEGLLASFPKLISTDQQHTYVETDNVRYVYQPVESLYVLLITTKSSNIVEDLETLRLLGKILPEYSPRYGVVDEETVLEASFEIICSFDEVIDWGGGREAVNLQQIATFTEMYSHEERLAKMIEESKMQEAKEEMKRKAAVIRSQKGDGDRLGVFGVEIGRVMQSAGLGGLAKDLGLGASGGNPAGAMAMGGTAPGRSGISSESFAAQQQAAAAEQALMSGGMSGGFGGMDGGMGGGGGGMSSSEYGLSSAARSSAAPVTASTGGKGMALGKSKKQDTMLAAMRAEGEVVDALPVPARPSGAGGASAAPVQPAISTESVHLSTVEKISAVLNRDGGDVENIELKGDLMLRVSDAAFGAIRISVAMANASSEFQIRTHPNIDKALFTSSNVLGLKDPSRPFPVGNPLGILRWRVQSKEEKMLPLRVTCWPSETGSESQVNLEFELLAPALELRDVAITIPTHTGSTSPKLVDCDAGAFSYNQRIQSVVWSIPRIDQSSSQGNLEFTTPLVDSSSFFPVAISFMSRSTFLQLSINGVAGAATNEAVKYSADSSLSTDNYMIE